MSLAALAAAIVIFPNDAMGQKNGMPDLTWWVNPMIGTVSTACISRRRMNIVRATSIPTVR